jgi:hypothetical protein
VVTVGGNCAMFGGVVEVLEERIKSAPPARAATSTTMIMMMGSLRLIDAEDTV